MDAFNINDFEKPFKVIPGQQDGYNQKVKGIS